MQVTSCAQIFFENLNSLAFEEPRVEELSAASVSLHVNVLVITTERAPTALV